MVTETLDIIIRTGNVPPARVPGRWIVCRDGYALSVVAGEGAHCTQAPDGTYATVEVGCPTARPEPWTPVDGPECWSRYAEEPDRDPRETIYDKVPVALVRLLIALHGGEVR